MKQATNYDLFVLGAATAAFSLAAIFGLQGFAGGEARFIVYLPWLLALAIGLSGLLFCQSACRWWCVQTPVSTGS